MACDINLHSNKVFTYSMIILEDNSTCLKIVAIYSNNTMHRIHCESIYDYLFNTFWLTLNEPRKGHLESQIQIDSNWNSPHDKDWFINSNNQFKQSISSCHPSRNPLIIDLKTNAVCLQVGLTKKKKINILATNSISSSDITTVAAV